MELPTSWQRSRRRDSRTLAQNPRIFRHPPAEPLARLPYVGTKPWNFPPPAGSTPLVWRKTMELSASQRRSRLRDSNSRKSSSQLLLVELNMISKSAIHAFLARMPTPDVTLAAFNAAFTLYFAITSATEVIVALSLSYLKTRADLWRLIGFTAAVLTLPWGIAVIAAVTATSHCEGVLRRAGWGSDEHTVAAIIVAGVLLGLGPSSP